MTFFWISRLFSLFTKRSFFFLKMYFLFQKNLVDKNFMEITFPCGEQFYPSFAKKRHGWTKNWQIFSYFSFLLTMTFFPLMSWLMKLNRIRYYFWFLQPWRFVLKMSFLLKKRHGWKKISCPLKKRHGWNKISCPHDISI